MLNRLNQLSIAAYVKAILLVQNLGDDLRELKEDQRGLSGVVVAVLLIVIAVLAIVMLWGSLKTFLTNMWRKVTGEEGKFTGGSSF